LAEDKPFSSLMDTCETILLGCKRLVNQQQNHVQPYLWESTYVLDQVKSNVNEAVRTVIRCRGLVVETASKRQLSYLEEVEELFNDLETELGYLREEKLNHALIRIDSIITIIKKLQGHTESIEQLISRDSAAIALEQRKKELEQYRKENEKLKRRIETLTDAFIGEHWLVDLIDIATEYVEISEPWFRCACAVNLLEASIKKKLEKLNEPTELKSETLEKCYSRLLDALRRRGVASIDLDELKGVTLPMLWAARNKIDHEGHKYKPTPKEASNIVNDVVLLIQKLFSLQV